jgi:hypothetical protein
VKGFHLPGLAGLPAVKTSKYKNVRTNGYASKAEADYANHLSLLKRAGKVLDYIEQVPIKLPGKLKYVADFMVLYPDGSTRIVEVKGREDRVWKMKFALLREARPELFKILDVIKV